MEVFRNARWANGIPSCAGVCTAIGIAQPETRYSDRFPTFWNPPGVQPGSIMPNLLSDYLPLVVFVAVAAVI
ncbi:MAG: hypothetical protein ACREDL_07330, partial [Bradyrhizobium sp.]